MMLDTLEALERLGCSRATFERRYRKRLSPRTEPGKRGLLYDEAEVEALLADLATGGTLRDEPALVAFLPESVTLTATDALAVVRGDDTPARFSVVERAMTCRLVGAFSDPFEATAWALGAELAVFCNVVGLDRESIAHAVEEYMSFLTEAARGDHALEFACGAAGVPFVGFASGEPARTCRFELDHSAGVPVLVAHRDTAALREWITATFFGRAN